MDLLSGEEVYEQAVEACRYIQRTAPVQSPAVGVICGSGLGGLAEILGDTKQSIPYADIPHFPQSTVHGHAGELVLGKVGDSGRYVVMMVGRAHFYEGHSIQSVVFPIRVLKLLGLHTLIITNAAGGLNNTYQVGDLVLINDHISLAGLAGNNPLRGLNVDDFGVRFPPLSDAYDLELRRLVHQAWVSVKTPEQSRRGLHEGVYAYVSGPSYETRAECRLLRGFGADLVGMSTVPEVIVARHCGIKVVALSLVTNSAVLDPGPLGSDATIKDLSAEQLLSVSEAGKANHQEVLDEGKKAAQEMQNLVKIVLVELARE